MKYIKCLTTVVALGISASVLLHGAERMQPTTTYKDHAKRVATGKTIVDKFQTVRGNGNITDKTLRLNSELTSLSLNRDIEVKLVEDIAIKDNNTVVITTDNNILEHLEINTSGGLLKVSSKEYANLKPTGKYIIIKVKKNNLTNLQMSGAAELLIAGSWKMPKVEILMSGTSELLIAGQWQSESAVIQMSGASEFNAGNIDIDRLTFKTSGASEVTMNGKARYAEYTASGASEIENQRLVTDKIEISASGASELKLYPVISLAGKASGTSEVTYYSIPQQSIDISKSKISSVRKKSLR